jgi:hypothetical protein
MAMTFEQVLPLVKQGHLACRRLWLDSGGYRAAMTLELVQPVLADGRPLMPQLVINSTDGIVRPFGGANWDLLADDWELVTGEASE